MENLLEIQNQTIPYNIKVSRRARRMRISVAKGGEVSLTLPWGMKSSVAVKFLTAKSAWILKARAYLSKFKPKAEIKSGKREYLKHKETARNLAHAKLLQWNNIYNFKYNRVSIRNTKSRWGSCSKRGNLNFNFKIVHLPKPVLDYLIVHELCHLKEFNHSRNFWNLVGQTIPNYKSLRKELRSF